jgi:hypothetical protein
MLRAYVSIRLTYAGYREEGGPRKKLKVLRNQRNNLRTLLATFCNMRSVRAMSRERERQTDRQTHTHKDTQTNHKEAGVGPLRYRAAALHM